jgi:RNA polymerase-interacting CarD/CdnL/TRCF family regulator
VEWPREAAMTAKIEMSYAELLKTGSMNEIAEELIDLIIREQKHRYQGYANQKIREALMEFFERGACATHHEMHSAAVDARTLAAVHGKALQLSKTVDVAKLSEFGPPPNQLENYD